METMIYYTTFILGGIGLTMQLLLGGLAIGLTLGVTFAILSYHGIGVFLIFRITSLLRGTPLILQLSIVYFALPGLTGIKLTVLTAGILTFGLNSAAYISQIMWAGIKSVPKGQFEAAQALRIPTLRMWRNIILPQVIHVIFPALVNEIIALLKETALIATIGGMDMMRKSQLLAAEQFTYFTPLCIAGAYYYILVLCIEGIGRLIEKGGWHAQHSRAL